MDTNISSIARLQEANEARRKWIMNSILPPFGGLTDAQTTQSSIANEAQPQDAEALSDGLPANVDRRRPIGTNIYGDIGYVDTQELIQPYKQTGNLSGLLRYLAAFATGAADFGGKILLETPSLLLANLGKGTRPANDLLNAKTTEIFKQLGQEQGIPEDELQSLARQESFATSAAKDLDTLGEKWGGLTEEAYRYTVGDNPEPLARWLHGSGTSYGYMLMSTLFGMGINALPLLAKLGATSPMVARGISQALGYILSKNLESASEAGSFLAKSYAEKPDSWDDALKVANLNFGANALGNIPINALSGFINSFAGSRLGNPLRNYLVTWLGEQANELPQETLQLIVENASDRTLKSGDTSFSNFLANLKAEAAQAPRYFKQLASDVAGSTTISHALTWLLPFGARGGRLDNRAYKEQLTATRDALQEELTRAQGEQAANPDNTDLSFHVEDLTARINDLNQSIADVQDELDRETLDLYPTDEDATPPAGQDEQPIPPFNLNESNTTAAEEQDDLDGERYNQASKRRMGLRNSLSSFFDASLPLDDTRLIPPEPSGTKCEHRPHPNNERHRSGHSL